MGRDMDELKFMGSVSANIMYVRRLYSQIREAENAIGRDGSKPYAAAKEKVTD